MGEYSVLSARSRTVGRSDDIRAISEFLEDASGRGLHIVGDAGLGKTTVLDVVAEAVAESGTRVLRAAGVEFEADVAYAGLHQLLTPLLDRVGELPAEHRSALEVALGLGAGPVPDRLLVVNAVLALLRLAAADDSVLLVVDDVQWLDRASAVVLGSVTRRLVGTRMGFLAASRSGASGPLDRAALAEYELAPLDEDSARLLLGARFPGLAPKVRSRVIAEAEGNPLVLLELPGQLSRSQATADEELPAFLSLGDRARALYVSRVAALPTAGRRLLLLAALAHTADLGTLSHAVSLMGSDSDPVSDVERTPGPDRDKMIGDPASADQLLGWLAAAEHDRLVRVDIATRRLVFHHPLIRSTVVDAATLAERRRAHLALAATLVGGSEARAWHLAEAALAPDETVAKLLQESAHTALRRGDTLGAVARLIRAADLSPDSAGRNRRLVEAAYVGAEASGDIARASDLLRRAQSGTAAELGTSGALYAAAAAAYVLVNNDAPVETAHRLLVGAIHAAGPDYDAGDPALIDALHTLQLVCWWSGREEAWTPFFEVIDKLGPDAPPVLAVAAKSFPDPARTGLAALPRLDDLRSLMRETNDPTTLIRGATATVFLDRVGEIYDRLWELVRSGRDGGGLQRRHIGALMHLCMEDFLTGEWEQAQQLIDEGLALCRTGYPFLAWYFQYNQVLLHGARGEAEAGKALADEMVRWAARRGAGSAAVFAHQAYALVCAGSGDYDTAYTHATASAPAGTLAPYAPITLWGIFDLVESAMRTGRRKEALAHLRTLRELKIDHLSDRYAMIVAGAAGLTATGEEAIAHFRAALAVPGADRWVLEAARIRLALGKQLRRTATKAQALEPLTAALDSFVRLGATPWAERTAKELRAAGRATALMASGIRLTPQELEIARMAASGLTNKQIGARLYLSHRTVGAHLYQMFPKLGITTRAALRDALVALNDGS